VGLLQSSLHLRVPARAECRREPLVHDNGVECVELPTRARFASDASAREPKDPLVQLHDGVDLSVACARDPPAPS
jgi:hypothetical protein